VPGVRRPARTRLRRQLAGAMARWRHRRARRASPWLQPSSRSAATRARRAGQPRRRRAVGHDHPAGRSPPSPRRRSRRR
jgi:hypothetical protein